MKKILILTAVLSLFGGVSPTASALEIAGQSAKNLYLAMNGFVEEDIVFYSLRKVASSIECVQSYRSIKYNYHQECTLVDAAWGSKVVKLHDIDYHTSKHVEGAELVIDSLKGAKRYADGGNPPAISLRVTAECILHSPIALPADEDPKNFTCKFVDL